MFKGAFSLIFPWLEPHTSNNNKNEENNSLHAESILLEEFNYASVTLYQLKEERSRLFNLYLLIVGILATGLGTIAALYPNEITVVTNKYGFNPQVIQQKDALVIAVVVLFGMSLLSFGFFVRLLRLNKSCTESLIALNKIKEMYINRIPQIENAFFWRLNNIPKIDQFGSSVFLIGFTTSMIAGVCAGGALLVFLNPLLQIGGPLSNRACITYGACGPIGMWILTIATFFIVNLLFYLYYRNWKKHLKLFMLQNGHYSPFLKNGGF